MCDAKYIAICVGDSLQAMFSFFEDNRHRCSNHHTSPLSEVPVLMTAKREYISDQSCWPLLHFVRRCDMMKTHLAASARARSASCFLRIKLSLLSSAFDCSPLQTFALGLF